MKKNKEDLFPKAYLVDLISIYSNKSYRTKPLAVNDEHQQVISIDNIVNTICET